MSCQRVPAFLKQGTGCDFVVDLFDNVWHLRMRGTRWRIQLASGVLCPSLGPASSPAPPFDRSLPSSICEALAGRRPAQVRDPFEAPRAGAPVGVAACVEMKQIWKFAGRRGAGKPPTAQQSERPGALHERPAANFRRAPGAQAQGVSLGPGACNAGALLTQPAPPPRGAPGVG